MVVRLWRIHFLCLNDSLAGTQLHALNSHILKKKLLCLLLLFSRGQPRFVAKGSAKLWDVPLKPKVGWCEGFALCFKCLILRGSGFFLQKNDIIPPCTRKENIKTKLCYNKLEDLKKSSIVNRSEFNLLYIVAFAYWSWRRRKWKGTGRKYSKVLTKPSQGIMTLVTRKIKKRLCMTIDILTWKYGKVYFSKFLIILLSIEYYCAIF